MARFDVYANPTLSERMHTPYLVDVQNDHLEPLQTRVVIPLRRESVFGPRARDLNPVLTIAADTVVLDTAALAAVPLSALRHGVSSLKVERDTIQDALDALFGAY